MNERPTPPDLSIVIPAYNEHENIVKVLDELAIAISQQDLHVEVLVVDDGSSDSTRTLAENHRVVDHVLFYSKNKGRAYAIQRGISKSSGIQVAVFDADFEYMPADLFSILRAADNPKAVVYGSRYLNKDIKRKGIWGAIGRLQNQSLGPWFANLLVKFWVAFLYQQWYSEHFSGIRIYPGNFIRQYKWRSSGFEGDHEIASAAHVLRIETVEYPISYNPRTKAAGKKIRSSDGFKAIWVFLDWRVRGISKLRDQSISDSDPNR